MKMRLRLSVISNRIVVGSDTRHLSSPSPGVLWGTLGERGGLGIHQGFMLKSATLIYGVFRSEFRAIDDLLCITGAASLKSNSGRVGLIMHKLCTCPAFML